MSNGEGRTRSALVTYFPMVIAVLSLCASIYSTFLYSRFLDIVQQNVGRLESLHTCKDIIDAYFQVKMRARMLSRLAAARGAAAAKGSPEEVDAVNAVSRFEALGTYLANLADEATRVRYTALSEILEKIVHEAAGTPPADLDKLFAPADDHFTSMNNDCVRKAKGSSR